jgi:hypothetical protein
VVWLIDGWGQPESQIARPDWWSDVAIGVAAAFVVAGVLLPQRWRGLALSALAIGALLDAPTFLFLPESPPTSDQRRLHELDDVILPRLQGVREHYRIYDEFVLGERVGARQRVRDFRGYPAVDPLSQGRYVDVLEFSRKEPEILADFNVRYVLYGIHFRFAQTASFVHMPHAGFVDRGDGIYEADHPAPLIQWYGSVMLARDQVLAAVRGANQQRAIVEPDAAARIPYEAPFADEAAKPGTLVDYEPDEIATTVDAPRAGLVVLDELWYPGWTVTVDGADAELLRANYLMRAVWVGAGHHDIVWRFQPRSFRPLFAGYALAVLAVLAAAADTARRRFRRAS